MNEAMNCSTSSLVNRDGPLGLGTLLEPAQRRRTRKHRVALTRGLNHQVVAKGIVIVQVFVPQRDRVHALTHHRLHVVTNLSALALVTERARDRRRQPHPPVDLAHQQRTAIGGNRFANEVPHHLALAAV